MHFRNPEMAREMEWRLRFGSVTESDTCFGTFFYSSNVANTEKYLAFKKAETQQRWKVSADMKTEVDDDEEGAKITEVNQQEREDNKNADA
jgi:hypothetical protein